MIDLLDDNAQTVLDGAINSLVDTLDIVAVPGSPTTAPFRIWIGDETLLVTGMASVSQYSVVRGAEGSVAASHSNGEDVFYPLTSGVSVQLEVEIARLRMAQALVGTSGAGYWTILTNGVIATPELIFASGDVISIFVP